MVVISLRTGGLKGQASHGSTPRKAMRAFLATVPSIPRVEHYPAWSKDAVAPCAAGRRPDSKHRKSPPKDGSKVSLRLSRPGGSTEPRAAGGVQPLRTQGLAHLLTESSDCKGPTSVWVTRYHMPPLIACKIGKSHFGLVRTDSRSGSDSELFQIEFWRLALKKQMDSGSKARSQKIQDLPDRLAWGQGLGGVSKPSASLIDCHTHSHQTNITFK